jgi:phospholipid/cholesterol/gamma-HCH transport system substrate-binding protein
MPVREKKRERTAGLFVLIGLILLGVLIVEFGRFGDRFRGHYPLYVEFPDTAGIIKNSEVRLRGAKIGRVATRPELRVTQRASSVRMEMRIRNDVQIPFDSVFEISSSGLLGDKYIEIVPPDQETGDYYQSGDTIAGRGAGGFDSLKSNAEDIARDTSQLIKEATVTFEKIDQALESLQRIGKSMDVTMSKINDELLSQENLDQLTKTIANFETSSDNLKTVSAELKPTITEARDTFSSMKDTSRSVQDLVTDARAEIKRIRPALKEIPKAVQSISSAAAKAEATMSAMQDKDGMFGVMAHDQETGTNTKEFVKNLKRYGILRYRDDSSPENNDPRNKFRGSRR